MDVFTFEVSRSGMRFSGGLFDGHFFVEGEALLVQGQRVAFVGQCPTIDATSLESGFWLLSRTAHRGFPAVVCRFFNRRSQRVEERYFKVFYQKGTYRCGPRFPKRIREIQVSPKYLEDRPMKKAA